MIKTHEDNVRAIVDGKTKRLRIATAIMWVVAVVVTTIIAVNLGWPWYLSFVAGAGVTFVLLWVSGEIEDSIIEKAYGPWKR